MVTPGVSGPPSLIIDDQAGSTWTIAPGETFTIGREGDLTIANPYLHARLLGVAFHAGWWWLSNTGRYIPVRVIDKRTGASAVLRSGAADVIVGDLLLVFEAGPTTYEIAVGLSNPLPPPVIGAPTTGERLTITHGDLTTDQRLLLTAMAEPLLRYPGTGLDRMPTIPAVADRLEWSVTKTNRQLDRLCEKLADAGVSGLVGDGRGTALNRRTRLVEYALDARLVTPESLPLLDTIGT